MTLATRTIRFRPAREDDTGAILDIWHEGWWDAHGAVAPEALRRHRDRDGTATRISPILPDIAVAEIEGTVAGFVSVDGDEIVNFYIARACRGSGLARELLTQGERMIAEGGSRDGVLWCAAGNDRAYRFYLKEGWRDEGVQDYGVPTPDGPVPVRCHRMIKTLAGPDGD